MHKITEFRRRRRQRIIEYLGGHCKSCGSNQDLEIDHVDPATKNYSLSGNHLNKAWHRLLDEIHKCQLLCKNCHLHKSRAEAQLRIPWNKGKTLQGESYEHISHGTYYHYQVLKCRCDPCRQWKRNYRHKIVDTLNRPHQP